MRRPTSWFALLIVLVLAGSACASSRDTGFPPPPTETAEPSPTQTTEGPVAYSSPIDVVDSAFVPKDVIVKVGTKVEWIQTGVAPHSVTASPNQDVSFDSHPDCLTAQKCMQSGDEFSFTFEKTGTFTYYCVIHGTATGQGMAGTVTVEA